MLFPSPPPLAVARLALTGSSFLICRYLLTFLLVLVMKLLNQASVLFPRGLYYAVPRLQGMAEKGLIVGEAWWTGVSFLSYHHARAVSK